MGTVTKTVYVICGLPFSGKTTYARSLLGVDGLLIERDAFLEEINRDEAVRLRLRKDMRQITTPQSRLVATDEANRWNDVVTKEYVRRVTETVSSSVEQTVVIDGTHLGPLSRSFVRALPSVICVAIVMDTKLDECLARLASTSLLTGVRASVTPELIKQMSSVFEPPSVSEGFADIRFVRQP